LLFRAVATTTIVCFGDGSPVSHGTFLGLVATRDR